MPLRAGSELARITPRTYPSNGVFRLPFRSSLLLRWHYVHLGFQNLRAGVSPMSLSFLANPSYSLHAVLTRDRREEAWSIVKRLHGGETEDEAGLQYAREEFYQMVHQVKADSAAWKAGGGWSGMLKNKTYRKRFWMGFFIQVRVS
jgi:hypothetical protein